MVTGAGLRDPMNWETIDRLRRCMEAARHGRANGPGQ